jgi:homogentisate 1,2-dioxygenase
MTIESNGYQSGFGNEFASEAIAGTLPQGRNSPQRGRARAVCRTGERHRVHRAAPPEPPQLAVPDPPGGDARDVRRCSQPASTTISIPARSRPTSCAGTRCRCLMRPTDFIDGLFTVAGNGAASAGVGIGIHLYAANRDMQGRFFYDADGELLIVPQQGRLHIETELGVLDVEPQEIAVIPRGIRFRVALPDGEARGYVCENFGAFMRLPDLGPIGSNGLANPRDFLTPNAAFEDLEGSFELIAKFQGHLWRADIGHSPLDVVGWHGNHAPYKYDLRTFNTIGSISYDHPDPSIFLVLTSPSDSPGVGNMDFVIFPPRVLVAQGTFRPPWFHRNIASEFMGLVHGVYDAKADGFAPGGCSLHNCMTGHGPDAATFDKASAADTSKPDYVDGTMAFMFESRSVIRPTRQALDAAHRQRDYQACWAGLRKHFVAPQG